ncbi:MAG: OmpA family protein [Alphaproteobacteria bacterium]|nr:OmpA family protein [Alphaproteobacteria bacterium]
MMRTARVAAFFCAFFSVSLLLAPSAFAQADRQGCKDYPGISRMPNFYLDQCTAKQFDAAKFPVGPKDKEVDQQQEGRYFYLAYYQKQNAPASSMLQIIRNLQNAARSAGGQVMADQQGGNWYDTTLKLNKAGKETWIQVEARDDNYALTIIEKQAMAQDVTMDARAMGGALGESGKVALYGIYFDTAKSVVKPESDPTLAEIAKLLKQNPALKVFIVGHTDMVGDAASNVRLSQARAQAVIAALTGRYGVAAARLKPFGAGPYAPVASNKSEEGRAKNRRVELVDSAIQ